jgi:hypothetical protein
MLKRLRCLALYNMYTITCFGSNDVVFFLSLRSHVSQHHPSSFLFNISLICRLSPHPCSWSSWNPQELNKIQENYQTLWRTIELSWVAKKWGRGRVWGWWHRALSLSLSYFSSLILVPRVGLPRYPMKSLPPAHNSGLAMPKPLGTFGSLLPAIAPTALLTHLLQAFALHPTSSAALLATLVCIEARPECKKSVQQRPQILNNHEHSVAHKKKKKKGGPFTTSHWQFVFTCTISSSSSGL